MSSPHVASVLGMTISGVSGVPVTVECSVADGSPADSKILGLPDASVRESFSRMRAALDSLDSYTWSSRKILFNLTPADVRKQGTGFDLPMAIAMLVYDQVIDADRVAGTVFFGELGLNGALHPVHGALPALIAAAASGARRIVLPTANLAEASISLGSAVDIEVMCAPTLDDLFRMLRGEANGVQRVRQRPVGAPRALPDLADVKGQPVGRRALEIAAAGGHHLMFGGPPGAGKTMLAKRLPGILPALSDEDAFTVTSIRSVCGMIDPERPLQSWPPFEAPHHGATAVALIGGGSPVVRPGAVSRAHRGVLFLDEAAEFDRSVLDQLRQPIESGTVTIHRATGVCTFPAQFQLVLAANPCPCSRAGGSGGCVCSSIARRRYQARLSGPLLDRVDLVVDVQPPLRGALLDHGTHEESSAAVAQRVLAARERAAARWSDGALNSAVASKELRARWQPADQSRAVLAKAYDSGRLTGRGYERVLRVAWTLADLGARTAPALDDLVEALAFRQRAFGMAA
ncbi:MAG: YifB family Mg chelatase-like AAA ATPase [Cumulibacter sp.]